MEKQLKDYAHLYLGAHCVNSWFPPTHSMYDCCWRLAAIDRDKSEKPYKLTDNDNYSWTSDIKLILRPLSDMTEQEAIALYCAEPWYHVSKNHITSAAIMPNVYGYQPNIIEIHHSGPSGSSGYCTGTDLLYLNKLSARQFAFLLSRGFDLFGLIESQLAIDKTQQQHKEGGV